jgi:hypothetical protein
MRSGDRLTLGDADADGDRLTRWLFIVKQQVGTVTPLSERQTVGSSWSEQQVSRT